MRKPRKPALKQIVITRNPAGAFNFILMSEAATVARREIIHIVDVLIAVDQHLGEIK